MFIITIILIRRIPSIHIINQTSDCVDNPCADPGDYSSEAPTAVIDNPGSSNKKGTEFL